MSVGACRGTRYIDNLTAQLYEPSKAPVGPIAIAVGALGRCNNLRSSVTNPSPLNCSLIHSGGGLPGKHHKSQDCCLHTPSYTAAFPTYMAAFPIMHSNLNKSQETVIDTTR